ncbi:MAG: hypothetical protein JW996_00995, partial [Candidatus Cloacimonetes bacterium]|nr:hypothetical protein [Candidatus Cloacimonadota bacterium]
MRLNSRDELKSRILSAVEKAESVAILTHIDPDGDGFCAALALQALLSNSGKPVEIVLEEQASDIYDFVEGAGRSLIYHSQLSFELLLILDCHETDRL